MDELRRFRRRQLVRIAWRDLAGLADVETVLARALAARRRLHPRGLPPLPRRRSRPATASRAASDGAPLELLVLGMGKLGGGELNFSSDIDLVFLFPEHGETDGAAAARARGVLHAARAGASRNCSAR